MGCVYVCVREGVCERERESESDRERAKRSVIRRVSGRDNERTERYKLRLAHNKNGVYNEIQTLRCIF